MRCPPGVAGRCWRADLSHDDGPERVGQEVVLHAARHGQVPPRVAVPQLRVVLVTLVLWERGRKTDTYQSETPSSRNVSHRTPHRTHLAVLHELGEHDDGPHVVVVHHAPEVPDGVVLRTLRRDVLVLSGEALRSIVR